MKNIIAIDPGNTESAFVVTCGTEIIQKGKILNADLLNFIIMSEFRSDDFLKDELYIEMVASYGMPVGKEVFDTCVFVGRLMQAWNDQILQPISAGANLVYRKEIKMHHCGNMRAKDGNIIQALKDKYGDKGTKKAPGYFFGMSADVWQAFALASYVMEREAS